MSWIPDEDDLEQFTQALTAKWFPGGVHVTSALDEADRAVAEKWLGKTGAKRLAATKRGERFRPDRPVTTRKIEFYYVPGNGAVYTSFIGWCIDVYEGARKRNLMRMLSDSKCAFVIAKLEEIGHRPALIITEAMRHAGVVCPPRMTPVATPVVARGPMSQRAARPAAKPNRERSQRFAIMDQLKGFKR